MAWGPWEPLGIGGAEHQIRFGEEHQIDREHQIGAERQIWFGSEHQIDRDHQIGVPESVLMMKLFNI